MNLSTAVVIYMPHVVQAVATPVMRQYTLESLIRVPAHITLMFPFVPYEQLAEAEVTLGQICADIQPFAITLAGYDQFPGVIFMKPADPAPIKTVFRKILDAFPSYPPYDGAFGNDLHPHVTVGEFQNEDEQRRAVLPDYSPITLRAERIHVIYGLHRQPLPWLTHAVIPFGS